MIIKVNNIAILELSEEYNMPKSIYDSSQEDDIKMYAKKRFIEFKDKFDLSELSDSDILDILDRKYFMDKEGFRCISIHTDNSLGDYSISKKEIENIIEERSRGCNYEESEIFDYRFEFAEVGPYCAGESPSIFFQINAVLIDKDIAREDMIKLYRNIQKKYNKYLQRMFSIKNIMKSASLLEREILIIQSIHRTGAEK